MNGANARTRSESQKGQAAVSYTTYKMSKDGVEDDDGERAPFVLRLCLT